MKKPKDIFVDGAITPSFIAESLASHQSKIEIGAHSIFIGQVRADIIDGRKVEAITYTAYKDMALEKMHVIREEMFVKYPLTCLHVHHSLGTINAGAFCLFVFTSSERRKAATEACSEIVERLKAELPIWGKMEFEDNSSRWKENT